MCDNETLTPVGKLKVFNLIFAVLLRKQILEISMDKDNTKGETGRRNVAVVVEITLPSLLYAHNKFEVSSSNGSK